MMRCVRHRPPSVPTVRSLVCNIAFARSVDTTGDAKLYKWNKPNHTDSCLLCETSRRMEVALPERSFSTRWEAIMHPTLRLMERWLPLGISASGSYSSANPRRLSQNCDVVAGVVMETKGSSWLKLPK